MRGHVFFLAVAACVYFVFGQTLPSVDEALAKVNEVIDIPGLKDLNLSSLNISALPVTEAENVLKKKCEKNGGPNAYENAKKGSVDVFNCVRVLVNFTELQEQMERARPIGELDEVFKSYCHKNETLKGCVKNFTASIEPCLDKQEIENKKIVHSITEKILSFICFKEGDRIALFIAAKGPECFRDKAQAIGDCVNATYGSYSKDLPFDPAQGLSGLGNLKEIKNLPTLSFDDKTCRNMNSLQTCVVNALEGCEDPTPANLLDSIFNYIKKVTPCQKILNP